MEEIGSPEPLVASYVAEHKEGRNALRVPLNRWGAYRGESVEKCKDISQPVRRVILRQQSDSGTWLGVWVRST